MKKLFLFMVVCSLFACGGEENVTLSDREMCTDLTDGKCINGSDSFEPGTKKICFSATINGAKEALPLSFVIDNVDGDEPERILSMEKSFAVSEEGTGDLSVCFEFPEGIAEGRYYLDVTSSVESFFPIGDYFFVGDKAKANAQDDMDAAIAANEAPIITNIKMCEIEPTRNGCKDGEINFSTTTNTLYLSYDVEQGTPTTVTKSSIYYLGLEKDKEPLLALEVEYDFKDLNADEVEEVVAVVNTISMPDEWPEGTYEVQIGSDNEYTEVIKYYFSMDK